MAEPFERRGAGGAVRDLEALLAGCGRICELTPAHVQAVGARHGVDFAKSLRTPRRHLYRRFLEHCLLDGHLSPAENDDLAHLRTLLSLDEADAAEVHEDVARRVYGRAIDQVLEDHRLDPDEEQFLARLRGELELSDAAAERLLREGEERARRRI